MSVGPSVVNIFLIEKNKMSSSKLTINFRSSSSHFSIENGRNQTHGCRQTQIDYISVFKTEKIYFRYSTHNGYKALSIYENMPYF